MADSVKYLRAPPDTRPIAGMEFGAEEISVAAQEKRLLSLELEMTQTCNLRCIYCYSSAGTAMPNEMSLDEIKEVVADARELGARKIILLGGGESCMYAHLGELIEFFVKLGMGAELFTNGTLIDERLARFLYDHGVSVVVKRNASDAITQDALAASKKTFERIQRGIDCLVGAGYPDKEHGLGVQTVICRQNFSQIPELWRWARSRSIRPYFECMTAQGRANANSNLDVSVEQTKEIFRTLCRIDREEYGIEWVPHPPLVGSACKRHLFSILIKADGDIYPCVGVEIAMGNIRRDSLATILRTHPTVQDLRNIYEKIKGRCRNCRLNGACYGCRGNAFQTTGDYLESDSCCWVNGGNNEPYEG